PGTDEPGLVPVTPAGQQNHQCPIRCVGLGGSIFTTAQPMSKKPIKQGAIFLCDSKHLLTTDH
ncbi:MAG TPA: hypothetical protein VE641_19500, partial [Chthoniobacterales bacterium]|nr:hypothetical protein [Chthoniobacterales bacterium]